jgi:hypothetical protein
MKTKDEASTDIDKNKIKRQKEVVDVIIIDINSSNSDLIKNVTT